MMRLVDADMFEESLKQAQNECRHKEGGNFLFGVLSKVRANLEKMPTVDAVPVVRCKDCKYFDKHNGTNDWNGWCDKDEIYNIVSDEFYCGFAERKVKE